MKIQDTFILIAKKKYVLPDDKGDTMFVVWLDGIVGDGTVNSTVNVPIKSSIILLLSGTM